MPSTCHHARLMTSRFLWTHTSLQPHPHTCNGSSSSALLARRPKKSALTHFPVYCMMLLHAHSHCRLQHTLPSPDTLPSAAHVQVGNTAPSAP